MENKNITTSSTKKKEIIKSIFMIVCIPALLICALSLYYSVVISPFEEYTLEACDVDNGNIFLNGKANSNSYKSDHEPVSTCIKLENEQFYHGEHKIPCYYAAQSDKLTTVSPATSNIIFYLCLLIIISCALFLLPAEIKKIKFALKSDSESNQKELLIFCVKNYLKFLIVSIYIFFMLTLYGDELNYRMVNEWKEDKCHVVNTCINEFDKKDTLLIYERKDNKNDYRNIISGAPGEEYMSMHSIAPGQEVACYYNPEHQAEMILKPIKDFSYWSYVYGTLIFILVIIYIPRYGEYQLNKKRFNK